MLLLLNTVRYYADAFVPSNVDGLRGSIFIGGFKAKGATAINPPKSIKMQESSIEEAYSRCLTPKHKLEYMDTC